MFHAMDIFPAYLVTVLNLVFIASADIEQQVDG